MRRSQTATRRAHHDAGSRRRTVLRALLTGMLLPTIVTADAACRPGEFKAIEVDYDASITALSAPMAEWSAVQVRFPNAKGITRRTVYITSDRIVQIDRGVGVKASMTEGVSLPMKGKDIGLLKYSEKPLHRIKIQQRNQRTFYDSTSGKATRRTASADSDSDTLLGPAMGLHFKAWDDSLPLIGKQTYAGAQCTARRIPGAGKDAQACVADIGGHPVALHFQWLDTGATQELQWVRAARINKSVCVAERELSVPVGVVIREVKKS